MQALLSKTPVYLSLSLRRLSASPSAFKAVMLYDGSCPVCSREVAALRTCAKAPLVDFKNITEPGFEPSQYGCSMDALVGEMHVLDPSTGTMHRRVPAFHHLYSTLGYPMLAFTQYWPFAGLSDWAYGVVARNKHHLARFLK